MKSVPSIRSRSTARWLAVSAAFSYMTATAQAEVPNAIAHQGRIAVTGVNFEGNGQFKFLLFADADADTDHASGNETPVWSNASTTPAAMTEPASAVTISVTKGLYGTWLGDTTLANMAALPASVEPPAGTRLYLRVWFGDGAAPFVALAPDQAIAAVPFALSAASVTQGGVTADALADGAVTGAKIAPGAVTETMLGEGSITSEKLAPGAVTEIGTPGQPGSLTPGTTLALQNSNKTNLDTPTAVQALGSFAYVVDGSTDRLQIFDVSNPDAIVARDFDQTNLSNPVALAVQGNFAYVVDSSTDSLQIFDISNPDAITPRDFDQTGISFPADIAVQGGFAYVVDSASDRLQIFDITDPDAIVARDFDQTGISVPIALAVEGNLVGVVDLFTGRMQVFDVTDPDNIVPRGSTQPEITGTRDIVMDGSMAFVVGGTRIQAFDLSDPDNIVPRGFSNAGLHAPFSLTVSDGTAFVYDHAVEGIHVYDITNPDQILHTGLVATGSLRSSQATIDSFGSSLLTLDPENGLQIWQASPGPVVNGNAAVTGMIAASNASITGTVSAGDFVFPSPKSFSLTIPGLAMLPQNPSEALFRSSLGFIQLSGVGGDTEFLGVAPVNLPQGAEIVGMSILYFDNSVANSFTDFTVRLRRVPIITTNASEQNIIAINVASPESTNNTAMTLATSNSVVAGREIVDNTENTYFVSMDFSVTAADANLRFYGFRINYKLTTLQP